jgi:dihydrodipicolinate synthase/N-acetylneuraminate lyase
LFAFLIRGSTNAVLKVPCGKGFVMSADQPAISGVPPIRPRRKITGFTAVLLPFTDAGEVDWIGLRNLLEKALAAGLVPAVNMDTGYANLIDDATRQRVLELTRELAAGRMFVAGAYVGDGPGAAFSADAYARQIEEITRHEGVPVIFQSFGLTALPDDELIAAYARMGQQTDRFIAFELGQMFVPFGRIYSLDLYRELIAIPQCIGAKHSSLRRQPEWDRLRLRDEVRPEFMVLTGNDLAIDMVMYGSDYLLGLSTFAPDQFAERDALWAAGDARFYELNDLLQYLGFFAFRDPVPAYKHSAAQFLKLRGWIQSERAHSEAATRPASDEAILADIVRRLDAI